MTCYYPMKAYRSRQRGASGKLGITFNKHEAYNDMPITIPCGQCIGCRLERSRQWAIRCMHEKSCHEYNCFITLTYNDENLPENGSLNLRDFQLFMKRLRKEKGNGIRYFHCGEYGKNGDRPHYHAILFGQDFLDKQLWRIKNDIPLYVSDNLSKLWPYGFNTVGAVTFQSAAYVARYLMGKVTGPDAEKHYKGRSPEYVTMSRRPGIGKGWLDKNIGEVYPSDEVIINGKSVKAPKYYDRVHEKENEKFFMIKGKRIMEAKKHSENNTKERLKVREKVKKARISLLKKEL